MAKIDMVCNECGSPVVVDATAQWNIDTQEWELCDTHEHAWCQNHECGNDGKYIITEKELTDAV